MTTLDLAGRSILFVGGKGGVGKSTTAGALAVSMADAGERVLLVSTDPAHSLADLFGTSIGDTEQKILPGLHALEIDPVVEVESYLSRVKATMRQYARPSMYSEIEHQIELTRHSPGAEEAALMDRVTALMDEGPKRHDRVIFDTAAHRPHTAPAGPPRNHGCVDRGAAPEPGPLRFSGQGSESSSASQGVQRPRHVLVRRH